MREPSCSIPSVGMKRTMAERPARRDSTNSRATGSGATRKTRGEQGKREEAKTRRESRRFHVVLGPDSIRARLRRFGSLRVFASSLLHGCAVARRILFAVSFAFRQAV